MEGGDGNEDDETGTGLARAAISVVVVVVVVVAACCCWCCCDWLAKNALASKAESPVGFALRAAIRAMTAGEAPTWRKQVVETRGCRHTKQ
jgi:hypothetical protein